MYSTIKTLSAFALAGSVLAAPAVDAPSKVQRRGGWGDWGHGYGGQGQQGGSPTAAYTNWAATETAYVTVDAPVAPQAPAATPAPAPKPEAPSGGQFYNKPSPPAAAPAAPAAPPASAPPSSGSTDGGYMSIVSQWRSTLGLSALTQDSQLQANAQDTANNCIGGEQIHKLNPGSFAQVLGPGSPSQFEHVFVGGWLCEVPSAIGDVCAVQADGFAHNSETGHYDILTNSGYSKIGCANANGVWACDLA